MTDLNVLAMLLAGMDLEWKQKIVHNLAARSDDEIMIRVQAIHEAIVELYQLVEMKR